MHIVYETLKNLGIQDKPVITVFNKQDCITEQVIVRDFQARETVYLSALTGEGLDELESSIEKVLREQKMALRYVFPYQEVSKVQMIRKYGELLSEEYLEEGILVKGYVPVRIYEKLFEGREDD